VSRHSDAHRVLDRLSHEPDGDENARALLLEPPLEKDDMEANLLSSKVRDFNPTTDVSNAFRRFSEIFGIKGEGVAMCSALSAK